MEYQEAIAILKSLLDRDLLSDPEKEAVFTAIGVLVWAQTARKISLKRKK